MLIASVVCGALAEACGSSAATGAASPAPSIAPQPTVAGASPSAPPAASAAPSTGTATLGDILFTIKPKGVGGSDQIWATTADGSRPLREIGPHGWWADLSPDGTTIAYTWLAGSEHFDIWTMHADGSAAARLTGNDFNGFRPIWSPDGTKLLFTGFGEGMLVVNRDGSGQAKVGEGQMGSWSPDGKQIAFIGGSNGDDEIDVMNADGSKQVNLTKTAGNDDLPAWSPDGKLIAFSSDRAGNRDIYVMRADGSKVVQLTTDAEVEDWPAWSPDGAFIAYERRAADGALADIWVMNVDGSNQRDLTNDPGDDDNGPSWR